MKNLKINKKKVLSLLLAMGISISSCCGIGEYISDNKVRVTGDKVNVRLTPTTKSKDNIVGRVNTGDTFTYLDHEGDWYLIDYYGQNAYINDSYGMIIVENNNEQIIMAKITGNNVNIRSSANNKTDDNIIGFADVTDYFPIIDKQDNWYIISYLGQYGYVSSKFVNETSISKEDIETTKMVYLTCNGYFYSDTNRTYMSVLPQFQFAAVIKEENGLYKVRIDGVIGYIDTNITKPLTNTFIVSDLGRQIVKVFKNNKEVYRAHIISGRKSMQTDIGVYEIGHKLKDYQLTPTNFVNYWMQYNGNEGFHDALWQSDKNFLEVAKDAYERFSMGRARTYPASHGSHGCDNLKLYDASNIYDIINVGDNVLVILPNDLIKDNIISSLKEPGYIIVGCSEQEKVKILV